jgi:sirohydrochlorin cobaltochelatase
MVLNLTATHKPAGTAEDPRAPMPAGPIVYREDGKIDWGNMWDSFCMLALDGGPPHRGELLTAPLSPDVNRENYHFAVTEIARGIWETSGLTAVPHSPGWLAITCHSPAQARWLAEAITEENVDARHEGKALFVPVGDEFRLKGEIKNVITAVAKTSHYWDAHLAAEVKQTLAWQTRLEGWFGWMRR